MVVAKVTTNDASTVLERDEQVFSDKVPRATESVLCTQASFTYLQELPQLLLQHYSPLEALTGNSRSKPLQVVPK